jgi:hypothetical protein
MLAGILTVTLVRESPLPPALLDGCRRRRLIAVTTFSALLTRSALGLIRATLSVYRNIPQHSNAISALSALLGRIIYARTCERTPMNALLFAQSVGRLLRDSTIGSATRACTRARRSLFAEAICLAVGNGAVAAGLPARMHWVVISDLRLVGSVSSRCWTKSHKNENAHSWISNNSTCIPFLSP